MPSESIWNRSFVHLFAIEVCLQFGSMMTRPIVSNYAIVLGAAIATAGLISGLNMFMALFMRPISGYASDRYPKKKLLVISTLVYLVSALGCVFASSVPTIAVFCAMQGIAMAFKSVSVIALATLCIPSEKVGSGIGWMGLINTGAMAVGPAMGSYLGATFGYQSCFIVSAALMACAFVLVLAFRAPAGAEGHAVRTESGPNAGKARSRSLAGFAKRVTSQAFYLPVLPVAIMACFSMLAQGSMSSLIMTVTNMGYIQGGSLYFLAYAAVSLFARPGAGRISDHQGLAAVAVPGLIVAVVGMGSLTVLHSAAAVVFAGACMGLGQASAQCALQAESVRDVDDARLGRATNTYYLGMDLGGGLGPFISGGILQTFGASAMFAWNAVSLACSLALVIAFFVVRRGRRLKRGVTDSRL